MKIAFVCGHLNYGGVERVVHFLARNFNKRNFDVTIITTIECSCPFELDKGIKHYQLKYAQDNKIKRTLGRIIDFNKYVRRNKFDVIVSLGNNAYRFPIISKLLKRNSFKLILSERTDPEREPVGRIRRKLRDSGYSYAEAVVCQTKCAENYYKKLGMDNTFVIPNPVRENLPKPYTGERNKEIVNFCRLSPQKNLFLLIDAFIMIHNEYPEFVLKIYGDGELEKQIREYISHKKMENKIYVEKFCSDILDKVNESYMFVSSSDYEGISNSMLEAMGIGLPAVCTDCPAGGAGMVIQDGINGQLVPVGDKVKLYEAMKKYIDDPGFCKKISENSVKIREEYSEKNICEEWIKIVKKVMGYENKYS